MFLNDAFDAAFDRQHRAERPIPSGAISVSSVWRWGIGLMAVGLLLVITHSVPAAILSVLLVLSILLYDAVHKMVAFSPVLMALCRVLLLLLATSFGQLELGGLALWSSLVLGGYIIGLSYIARRESAASLIRFWPLLPLVAPLVLAYLVNAGPYRESGLTLCLLLAVWMVKSLHPLWTSEQPVIGRTVSHLLAGICLVDLLAVADAPKPIAAAFVAYFGLSLLLQRYVPAT